MKNLKKKYPQIAKEHPKVDLNFLDKVRNAAKTLQSKKQDVTTTKVATALHEKRTRVQTAMAWLVDYGYMKKVGAGKRIPFFIVTNKQGDVDFLYGKKGIDPVIKRNLQWFEKKLPTKEYKTLQKLRGLHFSGFIESQNNLVDKNWQKRKNDAGLSKIKLASKAIRYDVS